MYMKYTNTLYIYTLYELLSFQEQFHSHNLFQQEKLYCITSDCTFLVFMKLSFNKT